MKQRNAARVGNKLVEFFAAENTALPEGVPHHHTERIRSAIFWAAWETVPDSAIWTRIQREGDNKPMIAALDGHQLYLVEVLDDDERAERPDLAPPSESQMIWVEPGAGTVTVRLRHRTATASDFPRSAEWRFELRDGTTLTIPTYVGGTGEVEDNETFARALCQALGFDAGYGPDESVVELEAA